MSDPVHIISLGAGVQSSTMALMAARGEITPMPTAAIFADTQAEPASVYRWLDWLEKQLPFPVHRVTSGNLTEISTTPRISGKSGSNYLSHSIPAYTLNADGTKGTMFRQCTDKSKLAPLKKEIKRIAGKNPAVVWIGISRDEILRMKPSLLNGITHAWPLIEKSMTRKDCLDWMAARGFPAPPRSACSYCPYHSNDEWHRIKTNEPEAFAAAIDYEQKLQGAFRLVPRLTSIPYLHPKRVPIAQIDFLEGDERGQSDLFSQFNNECEGMCGV